MKVFAYTLDKSPKKFQCPGCYKKSFVRYKNVDGEYIDEKFGRCDREVNCAYFLRPEENNTIQVFDPAARVELPPSFISKEYALKTYKNYEQSNLIKWLILNFGQARIESLIYEYRIGIDDLGPGTIDWVVFWQYDINNNIRSAKIIKYDTCGHRDKEYAASWYHSKGNYKGPLFPDFNLKQCLFGEHLIPKYPNKPIAIVESEKTALIASLFIDKYIWLACGGKSELRAEKMAVLKNRSVTLFPDLGAYEDWKIKGEDLGFNISDQIEKIATQQDRDKGLDIADFLLK